MSPLPIAHGNVVVPYPMVSGHSKIGRPFRASTCTSSPLMHPRVCLPPPEIPTRAQSCMAVRPPGPMHAPSSVAFPVLAFGGPPAASRSLCAFLSDRMVSSCSAGLLARNSGFFLARLRYRWLTLPIATTNVRLLRVSGRADATTTATQGRRVGSEVR